jgi:hypothetical protein
MGRISARVVLAVVLALVVVGATGCGSFLNKAQNTYIQVQYSGDHLLYMVVIPRTLPDGQPSDKQRDALLKDVAEIAGGYTYIERVMGAWKPDPKAETVKEMDDLLLVAGPTELGMLLQQRLRDDFKQRVPFVVPLPIQAVQVVRATPAPEKGLPGQKPPADQKAPEAGKAPEAAKAPAPAK